MINKQYYDLKGVYNSDKIYFNNSTCTVDNIQYQVSDIKYFYIVDMDYVYNDIDTFRCVIFAQGDIADFKIIRLLQDILYIFSDDINVLT